MDRFNVFILMVLEEELYKDIPFWTILLGQDFYPNHSFWDEKDGMIAIRTTDSFQMLAFKVNCTLIKYNKYFKNIRVEYKKYYGEDIGFVIGAEKMSGTEYFNNNANAYFEKTGKWIGNEPQDCPISQKFLEYNDFIDRTRSFNYLQMQDEVILYKPTLEDFFKKKLYPQYL